MIRVGGKLGNLQLLRSIATHPTGDVYLARESSIPGTVFVIKILASALTAKAGFIDMYLKDCRLIARLQHRSIAQLHGLHHDDGWLYTVSEYVAGQNLREYLADVAITDRPLFGPKLGAEMFVDLANGLAAAHDVGMFHGDVTPYNVMIGDDGVAKLVNFGLARVVAECVPGFDQAKSNLRYTAPENIGGMAYGPRADVFALGVVMWETFVRRRLFRGANYAEQLRSLMEGHIGLIHDALPGFPREISQIVDACLCRDPKSRFESAKSVAVELAAAARDLKGSELDHSLRRWLERRVLVRMESRRAVDDHLARLPIGSEIPSEGIPVTDASSASGRGSRPFVDTGAHPIPPRSKAATLSPVAAPGWPAIPASGRGGRRPSTSPPVVMVPRKPSETLPPAASIPRSQADTNPPLATMLQSLPSSTETAVETPPQPPLLSISGSLVQSVQPHVSVRSSANVYSKRGGRILLAGALAAAGVASIVLLRPANGPTLASSIEPLDITVVTPTREDLTAPVAADHLLERSLGFDSTRMAWVAIASVAQHVRTDIPSAWSVVTPGQGVVNDGSRSRRNHDSADRPSRRGLDSPEPLVTSAAIGKNSESPALVVAVPAPLGVTTAIAPMAELPSTVPSYLTVGGASGARVRIDGVQIGLTPISRYPIKAVTPHRLEVTAGDLVILDQPLQIAAGATQVVTVIAPAPPIIKESLPQVAIKTLRVDADGSPATGANVFKRCNACHVKSATAEIRTRRYTQDQWARFFASGQHDRYQPLTMSANDLMNARAFLRSRAADSAENQGAGLQEQP
jgi:serine/threonine protein kinase